MKNISLAFLMFFSIVLKGQKIDYQLPKHTISIASSVYPMFSQAIFNGTYANNTVVSYSIDLKRSKEQLVCNITFPNYNSIKLAKTYIADYSTSILANITDYSKIPIETQNKLEAVKFITTQLNSAIEYPVISKSTIIGKIALNNGNYFVRTLNGQYHLQVDSVLVSDKIGQRMLIYGFFNQNKSFITEGLYNIKDKTLEINIMSLCPYGQKAVTNVLDFLASSENTDITPEIHYIFYKKGKEYVSLHGEPEIEENLVQIVIREKYSNYFIPYLNIRFKDNSAKWKEVATQVGLQKKDVENISKTIEQERVNIIASEYIYVSEMNGVKDGSPTYIWEGVKVKDISLLKEFENIHSFQTEGCSK